MEKCQLPKQLWEIRIIFIVVLRQFKTVVLHVNFSLFYLITSSDKFYLIFLINSTLLFSLLSTLSGQW